jgi:hypothetical protein
MAPNPYSVSSHGKSTLVLQFFAWCVPTRQNKQNYNSFPARYAPTPGRDSSLSVLIYRRFVAWFSAKMYRNPKFSAKQKHTPQTNNSPHNHSQRKPNSTRYL